MNVKTCNFAASSEQPVSPSFVIGGSVGVSNTQRAQLNCRWSITDETNERNICNQQVTHFVDDHRHEALRTEREIVFHIYRLLNAVPKWFENYHAGQRLMALSDEELKDMGLSRGAINFMIEHGRR
jgi:uncharacterized protein YjiS (DUF1127 family)